MWLVAKGKRARLKSSSIVTRCNRYCLKLRNQDVLGMHTFSNLMVIPEVEMQKDESGFL